MANVKISALQAEPLANLTPATDVLPIVAEAATKKVTTNDLVTSGILLLCADLGISTAGLTAAQVQQALADFLVAQITALNLGDVATHDDAEYVRVDGTHAFTGDQSMGTNTLTNVVDPVNPQDAATKAYVDSVAAGLIVKDSVRAATTANITLADEQTVDTVALVAGDRCLVKNQTDPTENGIYVVVLTDPWTRATDADAGAELVSAFTFVTEGGQATTGWVQTTPATITLGVSDILWKQFSKAGDYLAGDGLALTGATFSVNVDGTTLEINADTLRVKAGGIGPNELANTAVTPGTYGSAVLIPVITVDADGRITALSTLTVGVSGAPASAHYFTSRNEPGLTAERNLGALSTGILFITVSAGEATASVVNADGTTLEIATAALRIKDKGVSYAKIQDVSATDKVLGRATAGSGTVEEITLTAAGRALIDDASAADQLTTLGAAAASALTDHLNDTTDAHDASAISVADSGGYYTATDVEAALAEIAPLTFSSTINNQTDSYTLVAADRGKTIVCNKASGMTITIPAEASVNYAIGTIINILQIGAGQVTVAITSDTLNGANGLKCAKQYSMVSIQKYASTVWVLTGDSTT